MMKLEYCKQRSACDKSKYTSAMKIKNCKQRNKLENLHKDYQDYNSGIKKNCNEIPNKCSLVCSKRYFKNWENATKSEFLKSMAAPKSIRLKPWPNPCMEASLPLPITKSSLYGKIPERCLHLAIPIPRKVNSKKPLPLCGIYTDVIAEKIPRRTRYRDMTRSIELAAPSPKIKKVHKRCMNSEQKQKIYYKPHKRAIETQKDWIDHRLWLEKNALPKIKREKTHVLNNKNQTKLTRSQFEEMVERLNTIPFNKNYRNRKLFVRKIEPRPPGRTIKPLEANWVSRLSVPRKMSSETQLNLSYNPAVIRRSALNAKASKRILELAEPKEKTKTVHDNSEYKIDPYKVSPLALTYKATKRIKGLAIPRNRS